MIYIFHLDAKRLVDIVEMYHQNARIFRPLLLDQVLRLRGGSSIMKLERREPERGSFWRTSLREDRTVIKASINLQNAAVLYVCTRFLCWKPILQLADSVDTSHSMAEFICQSCLLPSGIEWIMLNLLFDCDINWLTACSSIYQNNFRPIEKLA